MKYLPILISIVFFLSSCKGKQNLSDNTLDNNTEQTTPPSDVELNEFGMPKLLEYSPKMIDLGEVIHGEKRELEFDYKNISDEKVVIELVTACSCTTTDFTVGELEPGDSGKIKLVFDSTSKKKSETIDVDIILQNTDPVNDYPIVDRVQFKYELVKQDK